MMDWIDNPRAGFVEAAYAAAVVALLVAAIVSWWQYRRCLKQWRAVSQDQADETSNDP